RRRAIGTVRLGDLVLRREIRVGDERLVAVHLDLHALRRALDVQAGERLLARIELGPREVDRHDAARATHRGRTLQRDRRVARVRGAVDRDVERVRPLAHERRLEGHRETVDAPDLGASVAVVGIVAVGTGKKQSEEHGLLYQMVPPTWSATDGTD